MPYLDMVVSETLRLYPPVAMANREIKQSMTYNDIFIPKDVVIIVPIYSIHYDRQLWDDPEQFIPERFTPSARDSRNLYTYLPFGIGPRTCIGMRLALVILKLALVAILRKIKFGATKDTEIPLKLKSQPILSPSNPLYLGINQRF